MKQKSNYRKIQMKINNKLKMKFNNLKIQLKRISNKQKMRLKIQKKNLLQILMIRKRHYQ